MKTKTLFLAATVAAGVLLGAYSAAATAETRYGTPDRPLLGHRYQTLRALARHLDETAQGALEGATDDARRGGSSAGRFLSSIRSFALRAGEFHRRLDDYPAAPFEVPGQVDDLTARARQVDARIRSARALESTYDEWEAILDVLERMRLLVGGGDVEVPAAHVVAPLSGPRLQEFRELAQEVYASATRAHETAKREVGEYPSRGRQFLGELHYFATQSRGLQDRADLGQVDPQQIGPLVDRLLEEARQADRRMRDARVFTSVWHDSGRTITTLQRMASLVRS
jgi:hypothetical protein